MRFPAFIHFQTLIMKLFIFAAILFLFSCKKVDTNVDNVRVLQITVKDYRPTTNGIVSWAVDLTFYPSVTVIGAVNVEYDIYSQGALYKHYSYKVQFSLNNQTTFVYNTLESAQLTGAEIKNIKVSGLVADGGYEITIMQPKGTVTGTSSSSGCGYHNGHKLYKGSDGGCYYINSNGNKTYVGRSECNC
jgi:hypothetical protein